jgi:hypothetical protein
MRVFSFTEKDFKSELSFDLQSGVITWAIFKPGIKVGRRAGGIHKVTGYRRIGFRGVLMQEHHVLWFIANGYWANEIDHINGVRSDNRLNNLREVTRSENLQNLKRANKNSRSGHLGVSWHNRDRLWRVRIGLNGKKFCVGYFKKLEDAIAARKSAELAYHPTKPQ